MHSNAVQHLAAPEASSVGGVDPPLWIVRKRRHDLDLVLSPSKPTARIGHERRDRGQVGRIVERPAEDPAHLGSVTACIQLPFTGNSKCSGKQLSGPLGATFPQKLTKRRCATELPGSWQAECADPARG